MGAEADFPSPPWIGRARPWKLQSSDFMFISYGTWLWLSEAQRKEFNHAWDRLRAPDNG